MWEARNYFRKTYRVYITILYPSGILNYIIARTLRSSGGRTADSGVTPEWWHRHGGLGGGGRGVGAVMAAVMAAVMVAVVGAG